MLQLEDVLDPVDDLEPALLVDLAHVARAEPAVLETLLVGLRVVELLQKRAAALEADFPFPHAQSVLHILRDVVGGLAELLVVLEPHDVVVVLLADVACAGVVDARGAVAGCVFGHAVALDDVDAERDLEEVHDLGFDRRRAGQHELHAPAQPLFERDHVPEEQPGPAVVLAVAAAVLLLHFLGVETVDERLGDAGLGLERGVGLGLDAVEQPRHDHEHCWFELRQVVHEQLDVCAPLAEGALHRDHHLLGDSAHDVRYWQEVLEDWLLGLQLGSDHVLAHCQCAQDVQSFQAHALRHSGAARGLHDHCDLLQVVARADQGFWVGCVLCS